MFFSKALQMDDTLGMFTPVESGGSSVNWNNVINQGFALASQAFNSFGGQTVGTQFASNPSAGGVFALQAKPAYDDSYRYTPTTAQVQTTGGVGGTVGSGVDGIFNWLMSNPLITFGGIAGLYLLFREPPR
ncbi:MAG: hypothetical protein PSX80_04755, partial [bacterium]|nr:hypothetical protein [bacterium]